MFSSSSGRRHIHNYVQRELRRVRVPLDLFCDGYSVFCCALHNLYSAAFPPSSDDQARITPSLKERNVLYNEVFVIDRMNGHQLVTTLPTNFYDFFYSMTENIPVGVARARATNTIQV